MQTKLIVSLTALLLIAVSLYTLSNLSLKAPGQDEKALSLSQKSKETAKDFEIPERDKFIVIANQPLNQPSGITSTLMQYDSILAEQLKSRGKTLKVIPVRKGADTKEPFRKGQLDVTVMGEIPAVAMAAEGLISITALTKQSNNATISKNFYRLNDLQGKTIACPSLLSSSCYGLVKGLNSVGIKENEVNIIEMDIDLMPEALANGKIDAFCAWEPTPSLAMASYRNFNVLNRNISMGYLCMSNEFIKNDPVSARYITAAHIRAIRWMNSNRQNLYDAASAAIKESMEYRRGAKLQASPGLYLSIIKRDLLEMSDSAMINPDDIKDGGVLYNVFNYLKHRNGVPSDSKWLTVKKNISIELLKEVNNNALEYKLDQFDYNIPRSAKEYGEDK